MTRFTIAIKQVGGHARVTVWANGVNVGTLTMLFSEAADFAERTGAPLEIGIGDPTGRRWKCAACYEANPGGLPGCACPKEPAASGRGDQAAPIPTDGPAIWDLLIHDVAETEVGTPVGAAVLADMRERDRIGHQRYGVRLQAFNGRDFLRDAYEEVLDGAVYLRGALAEGYSTQGQIDALVCVAFELREKIETAKTSGLPAYDERSFVGEGS